MRICSLSPSATEMLCALGLIDDLVGVSHRCDEPAAVVGKPVVSQLLRRAGDGDAASHVYELDADLVRTLRPQLIVTQEICEACAVPASLAEELAQGLVDEPKVVSVTASTLDDVLGNVERLAVVTGRQSAAEAIVADARARIARVTETTTTAPRLRVAFLEWLDPLWVAGNWIPELVRLAGGDDRLGPAGARSVKVTWNDLSAAAPEVLFISACGLTIDETLPRIAPHRSRSDWGALPAVREGCVYVLDGKLFSRYTPRLVAGLEALAATLHPERFAAAADPALVRRLDRLDA